ncbi:GTPase, partial [Mycobacterium syngnathidarum]|uniref:GTPase n=1 Tax=Mycobacterium syngnathidarum TaxID=1908205 RepID=UPI001A9661C4
MNAIADATQDDPRLREVVAEYQVRASARPTVAVLGDFSAGKSSFVKRLLVETGSGGDDHPTVRADPTTAQVHRYAVGAFDLLDTPGFQSGRAGHEQEAIDGARDAAFVI